MKKLRKILLIVLVVVLVLFLLALALGIKYQCADIRGRAKPLPEMLTQTEQGLRYEIPWFDGTTDYVVFNDQRQVVEAEGFTPIHFDRKNLWGLWSYEDFVAQYGQPHDYFGNSDEAWITDDGYVIDLWLPGEWYYPFPLQLGNLAGEVWVYDLLATPE